MDPRDSEPLVDRHLGQPPELEAAADPLDLVVGSLQSQGFAWLKISGPETDSFQRLKGFAIESENGCFGQAGTMLPDKKLVEHYVGKLDHLPEAASRAADEVSAEWVCVSYVPHVYGSVHPAGMQADGPPH